VTLSSSTYRGTGLGGSVTPETAATASMSRPTGSADPASNEPACGSTRRHRPIPAYVRDVIALEVGLDGVRVLQGQVRSYSGTVPVGAAVDPGLVEAALDWIDDDEWVEVTPKNIRIRKKELNSQKRTVVR
jgi:hypothetical protein